MNKKLILLTLIFIYGKTFAQTGDVYLVNTTNCRMTVTLHASDPNVSPGCDYVSNPIAVNANATWGPIDMYAVENAVGWATSPAPLPCCPATYPASFVWTGADVTFIPCNILTPPYYTNNTFICMIDDIAPTGTCRNNGTSALSPSGATATFSITSATAPLNIRIDGN